MRGFVTTIGLMATQMMCLPALAAHVSQQEFCQHLNGVQFQPAYYLERDDGRRVPKTPSQDARRYVSDYKKAADKALNSGDKQTIQDLYVELAQVTRDQFDYVRGDPNFIYRAADKLSAFLEITQTMLAHPAMTKLKGDCNPKPLSEKQTQTPPPPRQDFTGLSPEKDAFKLPGDDPPPPAETAPPPDPPVPPGYKQTTIDYENKRIVPKEDPAKPKDVPQGKDNNKPSTITGLEKQEPDVTAKYEPATKQKADDIQSRYNSIPGGAVDHSR